MDVLLGGSWISMLSIMSSSSIGSINEPLQQMHYIQCRQKNIPKFITAILFINNKQQKQTTIRYHVFFSSHSVSYIGCAGAARFPIHLKHIFKPWFIRILKKWLLFTLPNGNLFRNNRNIIKIIKSRLPFQHIACKRN